MKAATKIFFFFENKNVCKSVKFMMCLTFQNRPYMVCMNHTKLIEAVLLNAGVPEDKLSAIMETLVAHQVLFDTWVVQMWVWVCVCVYVCVCVDGCMFVYHSTTPV